MYDKIIKSIGSEKQIKFTNCDISGMEIHVIESSQNSDQGETFKMDDIDEDMNSNTLN